MGVEKNDEELVRESRAGLKTAFESLIERYREYAHRLCYRMLGNHHAAEDASQEAFLRAYSGLSGFRGDAPFRVWFRRIVAHTCLNWRRSMKGEPRLVENLPESAAPPMPETTDLERRLVEAIQRLPEKQRLTLILRVYENCEFGQIAEILETSELAARVNLSLARKSLRETLAPHLEKA